MIISDQKTCCDDEIVRVVEQSTACQSNRFFINKLKEYHFNEQAPTTVRLYFALFLFILQRCSNRLISDNKMKQLSF